MRVNFDVLMILDALDRHGSFATAAESLYKPRRSELYDPEAGERSEHRAVDRSGHRAKFTDTGRLMLEKGDSFKCRQRSGKQAQQLSAGWERASHRP